MNIVVLLSIVLLITLLGTYLVVENNKKKAQQLQKRIYNDRVSSAHTELRKQLLIIKDARLIRPMDVNTIAQLATNFFVVQSKTEENLEQLENLSHSLVVMLQSEVNKTFIGQDSEQLKLNLRDFVNALPKNGRDFNQEFYQTQLPSLVATIATSEFIAQTEEIEKEQTEDDEQPVE